MSVDLRKLHNIVYLETFEWLSKSKQPIFTIKNKIAEKDPERIKEFKNVAELVRKLLNEELDEMIQAVEAGDELEVVNAMADLLVVASNAGFFAGIYPRLLDLEVAATVVSNNTKYCYSEKQAQDTVEAYATGTHPDKPGKIIEAEFQAKDDVFIITRKEDGKILKSINFKDVVYFRSIASSEEYLINVQEQPNITVEDLTINGITLDEKVVTQVVEQIKNMTGKTPSVVDNIFTLDDGTVYAVLPEYAFLLQDFKPFIKQLNELSKS